MADLDDWEVLLALHLHNDEFDGLITQDGSMLSLEREVSVMIQTNLTLIVPLRSGHSPVKATGLLFAHLPAICGQVSRSKPQVWTLNATQKKPIEGWEHLRLLAEKSGETPQTLFKRSKLSQNEILADPLSG